MNKMLTMVTAEEGARRIALQYLDQAIQATGRLNDPEDTEALHDFRVGMRRLRSCLRAYDDILSATVPKKLTRRLRDIARSTGPGRDAEVALEWIDRHVSELHPSHQPGAMWIREKLAAKKTKAYARVKSHGVPEFIELEKRFRKRLSTYRMVMEVGRDSDKGKLANVTAQALRLEAEALQLNLARVHTIEDETIAHDARIHGKRVRYSLDPFRNEIEECKPLLKDLKSLQEILGTLNDLHNLKTILGAAIEESALGRARRLRAAAEDWEGEETLDRVLEDDERPGLVALLRLAQKQRIEFFDRLLHEWKGEGQRLSQLLAKLEETAKQLDDSAREPIEIERKYLLRGLPPHCLSADWVDIDQGWIPGKKLNERLRAKRSLKGESYTRTVKSGRGVMRLEIEEPCTKELFESLFALTAARRVKKRRYLVPEGDLTWEIDDFRDRELVLAEVELPHENTEVVFPEWLTGYVVREVTGEDKYVNLNLAQ